MKKGFCPYCREEFEVVEGEVKPIPKVEVKEDGNVSIELSKEEIGLLFQAIGLAQHISSDPLFTKLAKLLGKISQQSFWR